jgi:hypothetical protein
MHSWEWPERNDAHQQQQAHVAYGNVVLLPTPLVPQPDHELLLVCRVVRLAMRAYMALVIQVLHHAFGNVHLVIDQSRWRRQRLADFVTVR